MARKNKALNPRQVDNLADGFWADGDRLFLRVADQGRRRSWVWRAVMGGKVTSMGLGRAGQDGVSLADARAKAKELNDTLDKGVNPLMARRERQRSEAARKTLREATEAYIQEKNRKWGESSRAAWRRLLERDIEVIADIPVDTFGREDIKRAVHALYRQTGKGNRQSIPGAAAARLEFIALTAVRVGEAANAKWTEFRQTGTWVIPASRMKMGRRNPPDHVVPLSKRAMEIIDECDKHNVSEYVFIGERDGAPISRNTIHDQCNRVTDGRASPHGWRATFRSWAASRGVSFEVGEAALAHMGGPLKQAYQRNDLRDIRRGVMEAYAQFLSGEDAETGNVVNFPKRA